MTKRKQADEVHPLVQQAIAQGFPATISDPAVLARIAVLVHRPDVEVKRAA